MAGASASTGDGFAAFLNAALGAHIAATGFVAMSGNQPQNARLHEYGGTGSGANTSSHSSYHDIVSGGTAQLEPIRRP
jgi:hypothetical protein